ncbi:hypothetical protein I4F81_004959 [Pyropia yezoensis]|uniref:Uncharacterized protein n=1 Tax=Pyropia yezoensis TaxID=2788 RepID=A0ACC3BXC5_PYRYE|nr:hypothetical protein I4F81_004959 [Neopyropia yezoensis]
MVRRRRRRRRPAGSAAADTPPAGRRRPSPQPPPAAGVGSGGAAVVAGGARRAAAPQRSPFPAAASHVAAGHALLSWSAGVWWVFAAATAVKLLLVPAYRSTDYDVHVHWLALTASTPLGAWYTDTSSRWGLDYPPLFALASRALAAVAEAFAIDGGSLVRLGGGGPAPSSPSAVLFMRGSVMAADAVLAAGTARLLTATLPRRRVAAGVAVTTAAAVLLHPGLLLVDHIHFQYNGLCLGVLLAAVAAAVEGAPVVAAVAAAAAFNLKHTLLPAALPLGVHLLAAGLGGEAGDGPTAAGGGGGGGGGSSVVSVCARAAHLGAIVISGADALVLPWLPFLASAPAGPAAAAAAIAARLVPTGRGLLHSYWAANAWAVVTAADRAACAAVRAAVGGKAGAGPGAEVGGGRWAAAASAAATAAVARLPPWAAALPRRAAAACVAAASSGAPSATGGVVGVAAPWALLPPVTPALAAAAAVVGAAPALGGLAAAAAAGGAPASARRLPGAVAAVGLAAFWWGYHVHEKAILLASVPLAVATAVTAARAVMRRGEGGEVPPRPPSARARAECRAYVWVALGGHWALLPLLPGPTEAVVKVVAVAGYAAVYLPRLWVLGGGGAWSTAAVVAYAVGMGVLEAYAGVGGGHAHLWGDAYPFVPLLLVSVYAAVGVAAAYGTLVWQDLWGEEEEEEEEEEENGGTAVRARGSDAKED